MKPTPRILATLLLSSACAFAQVAPATPGNSATSGNTPPNNNADGALVLSPFEVSASEDVGYIATNSLAGSRLNAALKDTPGIVDVFTKEFLADLGATDLETAMAYANNSQQDTGDDVRFINGNEQMSAGASFKFRSRGLPGSRARNYFETRLPIDLYMVERLDESRGPNSVLFGIGSAGGIVNSTTKRAKLGNRATEATVQVGSYGHFYSALDVNQPIIDEKLGVRLNAYHSEKGHWREYLATRKQGVHGAVTFRPFQNTEIRGEYEKGDLHGTQTRNYPPRDSVTSWWAAGSPTSTSLTGGALSPAEIDAGFGRLTTGRQLIYVSDQDYVIDGRNSLRSAAAVNGAPVLIDTERVPFTVNPSGPGGRRTADYEVYSASVEQRLMPTLFAELAFYHETGNWLNYDGGVGDNNMVIGDPNVYLRNPATFESFSGFQPATDSAGNLINPNVGRSYIDATWRRRSSIYEQNSLRASLAYELDLGRAGRHHFALMGQRTLTDGSGMVEREVWLGAPFANNPTANPNAVWRRNYITLGDAKSIHAVDPLSPATLTTNYPGRAAPLQSGWIPGAPFNETESTLDSGLLAMQNYWFNNRVVTTVGYRVDEMASDRTSSSLDPSGIWAGSQGLLVLDPSTKKSFDFSAKTKTAGIVIHPTPWLSVFANAAENFGLPNTGQRIGPDGSVPPPPQAKGLDGGISIETFGGKLVARFSYYDTTAVDQVNAMGVNNNFTPRYNTVIGILDDPNGDRDFSDRIYTPEQMAKYSELRPQAIAVGDTLDNSNTGYEARLTANLGGLRFVLNYSYTNQTRVNAYPRTKLLWNQVGAFIDDLQTANPDIDVNSLVGESGMTIAELLEQNATVLENRSFDFEQALGNREHKANVFGNYTFQTTRLKGLTIGGGGRYMSAINAGVDANDNPVDGSDILIFDAMAKYPLRFAFFDNRVRAHLQVNVRNLLDDTDPTIMRYSNNSPVPQRLNFQTPREVVFSFTARF